MSEKDRFLGRLTDKYIQDLFTRPPYSPIMPYVGEAGKELDASDDELFERIKSRIENEHGGTDYEVVTDVRLDPFENEHLFRFDRGRSLFRERFIDPPRRSTNAIWLKEDRMLKSRINAMEAFLELKKDGQDPNIVYYDLSNRARGYSTRQADDYIQEFFDLEPGESIEIKDHYNGGSEGRANDYLLKRICGRLEKEYKVKFYVHRGRVPKLVKVEGDAASS